MPRPPRQTVPGMPLHIVQRGNNRKKCFLRRRDFELYLDAMLESSEHYNVDIHAYVLMTNHVHLLVTPHDRTGSSLMMQHIGRKYVLHFNKVHDRTGSLWDGRFRSSIIDSDYYLLACYRYIELNPVRAGMTLTPDQYEWSSYGANALGRSNDIIKPRQEWINLGSTKSDRLNRYRQLFTSRHMHDDETLRVGYRKGLSVGKGSDPFRKRV